MTRFFILAIIYVVMAVYGFQAFKTLFKSPWMHWGYALLFLGALVFLTVMIMDYKPSEGFMGTLALSGGIFGAFFLFAMGLVGFLFLEDIVRLATYGYGKIVGAADHAPHFPSRRKFISSLAIGMAAIPFGAILYGMYKGKYNYQVLRYDLEFDDLPDNFHNYSITQISDVHSGSFDDAKKVAYGVDLINEQQSDAIFFTGDLVNNRSEELLPWKDTFSRLSAKDGVFSILGNHDYGDYAQWESPGAKAMDLENLKAMQKDMGFDLLLNTNRFLERDGQRIALLGVENWGRGFKKAGDLEKAKEGVAKDDFKILLSHDPSHWEEVVVKDDYHFHLTLSGHTHGMQFGVEIPGWVKWSPVGWRYKYWAGIYKEMGQFLNVNRGFGFLGYPGRFGMWPEITVITLKKKGLA